MARRHSSESDDSGDSRRSSIAKVANSMRNSVMSAVSVVEENIEVGTVGGTALNTICNVIGGGVLGLPLAFKSMGIVWAIVASLLMNAIAIFSAYVMFVACDRTGDYFMNLCFSTAILGKRTVNDSTYTASTVDGDGAIQDRSRSPAPPPANNNEFRRTFLSMIVDCTILFNNFLVLAMYCQVMLGTVDGVLKQFAHLHDGFWIQRGTWAVIFGVLYFALTSVRAMAELKWSSLLGVATILWGITAVVVEYCRRGYQAPHDMPNAPADLNIWHGNAHWAGAGVSVFSVAFGYHYNAPTFYQELQDRNPRKMMKTVAIAFPIITIAYLTVGLVGYISFGDHVKGMIFDNYGDYNTIINTVRLGLVFHFLCVYPVLSVCLRHSFHRVVLTLIGRREEAIAVDMVATVHRGVIVSEAFFLVATSTVLAYYYTNVGQMLSIIGSLCGNNFMMTFPGIIGMCIWAPFPEGHDEVAPLMDGGAPAKAWDHEPYHPPPFASQRILFFVVSCIITFLGVAMTFLGFASVVLPAS